MGHGEVEGGVCWGRDLQHGVAEDAAHSLEQQVWGDLSQAVQKHLQLLPVLHKHGLVFPLEEVGGEKERGRETQTGAE